MRYSPIETFSLRMPAMWRLFEVKFVTFFVYCTGGVAFR